MKQERNADNVAQTILYIRKDALCAWTADTQNAVDVITYPNAKINLGLNVIRKRQDGFHDIETLFVPLTRQYGAVTELNDTLEITPRNDRQVTLKVIGHSQQWPMESDLCVRAYRLMAGLYGIGGVDIRLVKRIPTGAGLGGGSSDAAFTLLMLNEMFSLGLNTRHLAAHAAELGSDTSFFIYNRPMTASGRGEILTECPNPIPEDCVIETVTPEICISTSEAYSGVKPEVPQMRINDIVKLPVGQWKDLLKNDFEESVFNKYPTLAAIKESLYKAGAVYASMSGSGSSLYGIFPK